jgi:hypothetical protein
VVGSVKNSITGYASGCDAEAVKRDNRAEEAEEEIGRLFRGDGLFHRGD